MAEQKPGADGGSGERGSPLFTIDFAQGLDQARELPSALAKLDEVDTAYFSLQADLPAAAKIGVQCQQIFLLNLISWPEIKTIWGTRCFKVGWWTVCIPWLYVYRRVCTRSLYLQVCHPKLAEIMAAIIDCLKKAVGQALLALLIQKKFSQFLAILYNVLVNCLQAKGVKLLELFSIGIKEEVNCSNWQLL